MKEKQEICLGCERYNKMGTNVSFLHVKRNLYANWNLYFGVKIFLK